jgi:hypothetical protein
MPPCGIVQCQTAGRERRVQRPRGHMRRAEGGDPVHGVPPRDRGRLEMERILRGNGLGGEGGGTELPNVTRVVYFAIIYNTRCSIIFCHIH